MRRLLESALSAANCGLLRVAALWTPPALRREWMREWRAELWHVRSACCGREFAWGAEREVIAFCLGAFADARSLRGDGVAKSAPLAAAKGSARRCLWALGGVALASAAVAAVLPGVRAKLQPVSYRLPADLTLIRHGGDGDAAAPNLSWKQYRTWEARPQKLFDAFAFYRVARERIAGEQGRVAVAYASANLLNVLDVPVRFAVAEASARGLPRVVLGEEIWKLRFGGDEHVSGRVVRIGAREAVVAGVVSASAWKLPGTVDAWVLGPEDGPDEQARGFVVARLAASAPHVHWANAWAMIAPLPDGSMGDFVCVTLREQTTGTLGIFLFAVLLACLALPATTPLAMGEHLLSARRIAWSTRLRRWGFLLGKIALLLPVVFFASADVAYARAGLGANSAACLQFVCAFAVCLFGLRWALRDQRERCPECLGRLTHPARVGQPSRNFLAWNGTELMCVGGHGLLHVPELATSWFSTQRWMYLDASWQILFASGYV